MAPRACRGISAAALAGNARISRHSREGGLGLLSPSAATQAPATFSGRSRFIAGPAYDRFFFIFSPLIALALGALVSRTFLAREDFFLNGRRESYVSMFSGAFTMAHLALVFARSHGNPGIFRLYPKRFILAPALLFGAMAVSSWALISVFVLAVWWDTYHSALQTFGLGRLYDAKAGTVSEETRSLDRGLNLLLYLGPIFGGAALADHVVHFEKFSSVGAAFFSAVPAAASRYHAVLAWAVGISGTAYAAYYLFRYASLVRRGHRVSREKAWLFASTGICAVWTWGFNPFGQAFFIMNFFHALQYFALVWHTEKKRSRFLPLAMAAAAGYGLWAQFLGQSSHLGMSALLTVSIMHFWYDGFIWSVRRNQVS